MPVIKIVKDTRKELKGLTLEKMAGKKHMIVMTPEIFSRVFSPERIRLIMFVNEGKLLSISDLARKLGRRFEAVHRDLRYLEGFGLVKLKRQEANKIPYIDDKIEVVVV